MTLSNPSPRPRSSALLALSTLLALLVAACSTAPAASPTTAPAAKPTTAPAAAPSSAASPAAVASPAAKPAASPAASPSASPAAAASPSPAAAGGSNTLNPAAAATLPPYTGAHTKLQVSYSNIITDNLPEWMAKESGIFDKNGLDVDLQNIASSTGVPAILSGQIQIGHLGGSEVISADTGGADLHIYATSSGIYPFVFMAAPGIKTPEDLKGKKVGVSNIGSSSDIATRVALTRMGLDPEKDVTIIAVGSLQNRMAALLSGSIQAGMAQPPEQLQLLDKGFTILYDMAAQQIPSSGNVVAAKASWVDANKDVMQRYIDSLVEAVALARRDKPQTLKVLSKYLGTTDERALDSTYEFYIGEGVIQAIPESRPDMYTEAINTLGKTNPQIKSFDVTKILDNLFVQNAAAKNLAGR